MLWTGLKCNLPIYRSLLWFRFADLSNNSRITRQQQNEANGKKCVSIANFSGICMFTLPSYLMKKKLFQAINPMILLHFPTFLNFVQAELVLLPEIVRFFCEIIFEITSFQVNQTSSVLMNIFPVSNPLLNILFSNELSNSLKNRLSGRKKSSISIAHLWVLIIICEILFERFCLPGWNN